MTSEKPGEQRKPISSAAGPTLVDGLLMKGYAVLGSNDFLGSASLSIILGGEIGMHHKEDFYELAGNLGLEYRSGPFYTQREQ